MRKYLFLMLLLQASLCMAQDPTDELLGSKVVRNYIHFTLSDKKLLYQLDGNKDKKTHKQMKETLSVTVPLNENQVALSFDFLNPFVQKIIVSESTEPDGTYASLNKFFESIAGLGSQLSAAGAAAVKKDASGAADFQEGDTPTSTSKSKAIVAKLNAPSLVSWKYNFIEKQEECVLKEKLFEILFATDTSFYRAAEDDDIKDFFPNQILAMLSGLSKITSVKEFATFSALMNSQYITPFEKNTSRSDENIKSLARWDYDDTFSKDCDNLKRHTKSVIDNFVTDVNILQTKRKEVIAKLKELKAAIDKFLKECDPDDNTMIVTRVNVDVEQVKIQTIKLRSIALKFEDNAISHTEDAIKDELLGKVRVRSYHLIIPEFAIGGFYTDLSYPKYGTKTVDGKTAVSAPVYDKYAIVAAAHLNLIVNLHGLINPMLQLGVGTAKELPSFLAGGGIRFSKPKHMAMTGGFLWTWRKELDKLKVDDIIENTAALDNDLKYRLTTKPAFYIGINYGF